MIRTSDVDGDAAVLSVDNSNVITHDDVVLNIIVLHGTSLCSLTATIILKFAFVWPDSGVGLCPCPSPLLSRRLEVSLKYGNEKRFPKPV